MTYDVGASGSGVAFDAVPGARLLKNIAIVTHCVQDLALAEAAWTSLLGYRTVERGLLDTDTCAAWDTPAAAGQRWCLMQPASGEDCWLRFVETGERSHPPPATLGWCATELLVSDVDGLARELAGSAFRRLGGPGDLYPRPSAPRAMQAIGPSGELVYFTRLLPGGSRYGLKQAQSRVDRPFIVTVAGTDGAGMHRFYGQSLGLRVMDRTPFVNGLLAMLCDTPPDTVFPTAVAAIPGRKFLVEMDEFPLHVGPRPRRAGALPGGMAMVSFRVNSLESIGIPLRSAPRRLAGAAYGDARAAVIEGAAGEWLELIEAA
ncbi:MAG: hypothetical protein FJ197_02265 [Gammaproteobacteria bacterium]|nr:hypothetical protein [Gammaproteobacteria bacterium]